VQNIGQTRAFGPLLRIIGDRAIDIDAEQSMSLAHRAQQEAEQ
jgi:hypothetical protein